MSGERRGRTRELRVADVLRERGKVCYRLAWGCADVIALESGERPLLVQVKSTAGGPFERFGPTDREALRREAAVAGAGCVLAWWPAHRPLKLLYPDEWPTPTLLTVPCARCEAGTVTDSNGARWRCAFCRGMGRVRAPP